MGRQAATPRIISKALGPKRSVKMSLIHVSVRPSNGASCSLHNWMEGLPMGFASHSM
jgi:hypothetical protein